MQPSADSRSATPPGSSLSPELVEQAGLTDRQRVCVEMRLRNFSYLQIADSLGLEKSSAYGHVQRGLRRLEKVMR